MRLLKRQEVHGGSLARGRKTARPLVMNCPTHLVFKARRPIWNERDCIYAGIREFASRFRLELLGSAVAHDHLHVVLTTPSRASHHAFVRALSAQVAKKLEKGIWKLLPFTRVADWDELDALLGYLEKNRDEAEGKRPYQPREDRYAHLRPR